MGLYIDLERELEFLFAEGLKIDLLFEGCPFCIGIDGLYEYFLTLFNHFKFSGDVADVDGNFFSLGEFVGKFEVEPASVSSGIGINHQMHVVFVL